ncbi:MAG: MFS transporter [Tetrasphaera sp.]
MRRSFALIAIVLVAVNLRPGATSPGPVLAELQDGLGMSEGLAGALTGLPGLCFGVIGLLAVTLARLVGTTFGIGIGLVAVVAGLLLRSLARDPGVFLVLSALALGGMALGNVLVPAWIKSHPAQQVLLQTVFGAGLMVGGASAALLTAPVADSGGGWRPALGLWGLPAALAVPLWLWLGIREHRLPADHRSPLAQPNLGLVRSPTTVALTAMFGIQSMQAYVQFGWLPQIYRDAGLSAAAAGSLTALLTGIGFLGALSMPSIIERGRGLRAWMASFGVLLIAGYLGLFLAPATLPWLWAVLLGVSGFAFPTAMALLTARTRDPAVTAQVSGFVQPIGYLLAALGPFGVGLLHAATGGWTLVLIVLAAFGIPLSWFSVRLAGPTFVDDELPA